MSTGPTNLYDLAHQLLAAVEAGFVNADVPAPTLSYVCGNNVPVAIADSLAVSWVRIFHGTPGQPDKPYPAKTLFVPRSCTLAVWCFRPLYDVLTGEGQTLILSTENTAQMEADAQTIMTDGYIIPKAIVVAHSAGLLGVDSGAPVAMGDVIPLAASGGVGGCRAEIHYDLT